MVRESRLGMDFNPTFFSHPKAADGLRCRIPIRQYDNSGSSMELRAGAWRCDGKVARYAMRDESLDSGRIQGHADRSAEDRGEGLTESLDAFLPKA